MKSIIVSTLCVVVSSSAAMACATQTTTPNTMAIQSPCSPMIVTANQKNNPTLLNIAIDDAAATVPASPKYAVQVQAPGMINVEVFTHNKSASQLVGDGLGTFTGTVDLSHELEGPMVIMISAWNAAPGDNTYTVNLTAKLDLFVHPSKWTNVWAQIPPQAADMKIKWVDRFGNLSATPCKPGTGTWPHCAPPTAADGFTWFENKPGGGDFGDAAYEHTDGPYNPFAIIPGFLRIRSTYDPAYVDPYGFKRHWRSGFLATAFNDGTTSVPMGNGYYEARIMVPAADASWNTPAAGGTWPAWWMLSANNLKTPASGTLEEDIFEQYGRDPLYTQTGQHAYSPATGPSKGIFSGHPDGDLTWEFHRYGLLITDTTLTAYLDDKPLGSLARGQLAARQTPNWFVMLDLAMGGGWPTNPPPAGYFDMWIDYARYLAP